MIPSNSTEVANKAVEFMIAHMEIGSEGKAMKRGSYTKFSQRAKIAVAKYAAEHGSSWSSATSFHYFTYT